MSGIHLWEFTLSLLSPAQAEAAEQAIHSSTDTLLPDIGGILTLVRNELEAWGNVGPLLKKIGAARRLKEISGPNDTPALYLLSE